MTGWIGYDVGGPYQRPGWRARLQLRCWRAFYAITGRTRRHIRARRREQGL